MKLSKILSLGFLFIPPDGYEQSWEGNPYHLINPQGCSTHILMPWLEVISGPEGVRLHSGAHRSPE